MTLQVEADYDLLLALKTVMLLPSLLMRRMYYHFCCHAVVGNILMTRYFRVVMGEAAQHLLFQRLISFVVSKYFKAAIHLLCLSVKTIMFSTFCT